MRKQLLIIGLILWGNAFAQSNLSSKVKRDSPVGVLHHKFNFIKTQQSGTYNLTVPEKRTCLTTEINYALQKKFNLPSTESFEQKFNKFKSEFLHRNQALRTTSTVITIPVIVHVVHNGEAVGTGANINVAQVLSQIDVLNEDFRKKTGTNGFNTHPDGADIEIEFAPALRDEFGNELPVPGIHRIDGNKSFWEADEIENNLKPHTIWDPARYFNIWTVNFGGVNSTTLGYAQFPSLSGLDGLEVNGGLANTDGIVVGYKYFGREGNVASPFDLGRTTTHEVGHWLGLRHIWGDGGCLVDDYCEDTPRAGHPNYGCDPGNSCPLFAGEDMIENYMDYSDDACMNIFTMDQKNRMLTVMNISPRRKELLNSTVHLIIESPIAYFTSDRTQICSGEIIHFTDESINSPTGWQWIFFGSDSTVIGNFSETNPSLQFNESGIYSIMLIVENSAGTDTLYIPNYISVLSSEELVLPYNENFETDGSLENWTLYNPDNDRTWQKTSITSSQGGSWSVFIDNYSMIDGDPTGKSDALISPPIDLSIHQNVYLTFEVAYAKYGGDFSDTLAVFISTDCGANFNKIWAKGGDDLATSPDNQESFVPTDESEWITEKIPLIEFNGNPNVHIAIMNISGWGNNLYLDNISIFQPSFNEPTQSFFRTSRDTVAVGSMVNFWDYSSNFPTSWIWEFEGGTPDTSDEQNPSVIYDSVGTFDVTLSTTNVSGGDELTKNDYITVVDNPEVTVNSVSESNSLCEGDSIVLVATGAVFYEWYDDRGYLVSENDTLISYPQINTTYEVTGYDDYGGSTTVDFPVTLYASPEVDLGEDEEIVVSDSLILDVGGTYNSYHWNDGSTSSMITVSGAEYGIGTHEFYISVTDVNNCSTSDTLYVTITPVLVTGVSLDIPSDTLVEGETLQLIATVTPPDANDPSVNWTSSDEAVATVSPGGLVTAISEGNTTIAVITNEGDFTATSEIKVTRAVIGVTGVTLSNSSDTLEVGQTVQLTAAVIPSNADDPSLSWTSSDPRIASVDSLGQVTALSEGETTITVTTHDGNFTASCTIIVNRAVIEVTGVTIDISSDTLEPGQTIQLTKKITPSNATDSTVIWTSNNEAVASVDSMGLVTAIVEGEVIISVTTNDGGFTDSVSISVVKAKIHVTGISIDITADTLEPGQTIQLTETVFPSDATDKTVIWTYDDEDVVVVDTLGLVTAVSEGTTTITVTANDGGFQAFSNITVTTLVNDLDQLRKGSGVKIYPVPVSSVLTIELEEINNSVRFHFFDRLGRLVISGKITDRINLLDIHNLSPGVYLLILSKEHQSMAYKILKE